MGGSQYRHGQILMVITPQNTTSDECIQIITYRPICNINNSEIILSTISMT